MRFENDIEVSCKSYRNSLKPRKVEGQLRRSLTQYFSHENIFILIFSHSVRRRRTLQILSTFGY